jgi:hypothetical protein
MRRGVGMPGGEQQLSGGQDIGVAFVTMFSPLKRRSSRIKLINFGCERWHEPSGSRSTLTPKKSERSPSTVMSSLTFFICSMHASISFRSGPARIESSVQMTCIMPPLWKTHGSMGDFFNPMETSLTCQRCTRLVGCRRHCEALSSCGQQR